MCSWSRSGASLMLLVGSGLLLQSFSNLRGLDPGFSSDHVLTMRLVVPEMKYKNFAKHSELFQRVLERIQALPAVSTAGFTSALPLTQALGGTDVFTPDKRRPTARNHLRFRMTAWSPPDTLKPCGFLCATKTVFCC